MKQKLAVAVTATLAAGLAAVALIARADVPTTAPAAAPTTAPAGGEAESPMHATLTADKQAFEAAMTNPEALTDPVARKAAAPKFLPAATKFYADLTRLAADEPDEKERATASANQVNTFMATFGDAEARGRLDARADSKDPAVATDAKGDQLMVDWWLSARDPAKQAKVAVAASQLAHAHPESEPLTSSLMNMAEVGPANLDMAKQMRSLISDVMKNPAAEQFQPELASERKMEELVGKRMTIKGTLVDGKPFTTADWAGKVVLVDFWATWCGPCKAELPRVEQLYAEDHAKGLEVLGVSNDQSGDDLKTFVKGSGGLMPWPQLFDAGAAEQGDWNPITKGYGIEGIPTMFLIDKHGVCRSVQARVEMEELVPKLLAEK